MNQNTPAGRQLGKYDLINLLGSGGMADVYSAYQPGLERMVAIKLLRGFIATSQEAIIRFRREARSVALLRHPNIIQVFDFDVEDNTYYMVMEYIVGGTLARHIYDNGPLPVREVLNLTIQLADALQYAHAQGVIHRDIKPVNIMFADADHRFPVITDFGIARIMTDPVLTAAFRPLGSPAYLSPEVAKAEPSDERTDIYSLGVTVYEMLSGKRPFGAETTEGILMQHVHMAPPPLSQFNVSAPEEMEAVLRRMLAKSPDDRFQSAADLKAALQRVQSTLTQSVSTSPNYPSPSKPVPKSPTPIPVNISGGVATPRFDGSEAENFTSMSTPALESSTRKVSTQFPDTDAKAPAPTPTMTVQKTSRREMLFVPLLVITAFVFGMFAVAAMSMNNNNRGNGSPSVVPATSTEAPAIVEPTIAPTNTKAPSKTPVPTTEVPTRTPSKTPTDTPTNTSTVTLTYTPSPTNTPTLTPTVPTSTPRPTSTKAGIILAATVTPG